MSLKLGRPTRQDAVSGFAVGLFSIPEGMAYASIGGFNPVLGLYAGMVPTTVGALFARTVLMTTTLTSAIALTSQSVLDDAGLDPTDLHNVATLTVLVGIVMLLFGLLRFGAAMSFVSNAVMTGFTTGIALQIIAGVASDATGYAPDAHNTLAKIGQTLAHVADWDGNTILVTAATVAVWAAAHAVRRLKSMATLIALLVVSIGVAALRLDVEKVGDIGSIPNAFPAPVLPDPSVAPDLLFGAVAVALVALAQAAGIGAAVPNPDGSRTNVNGDFLAQGAANLAGGFFRALPVGGSLSRTGVATSAGARTRWAGVFAGISLAILVIVAGGVAEEIPMPVIGGLILVIGTELIVGRVGDIVFVARTALLPVIAMVATFLATTQLPLQQAIFVGVALSLLLYCVSAQRHARLQALTREDDGHWRIIDVPAQVPSREVTVLHYEGVSFFAELSRLEEAWPEQAETRHAAVIVHLRALPDVPSSTLLKALDRRRAALEQQDCLLIIAGLHPALFAEFRRTGLADRLGEDHLLVQTPVFFEALDAAWVRAHAWVAARPAG